VRAGALFAFFRFTSLGLAMRAAAQNPDSARLVGIRVSWMLAWAGAWPPRSARWPA
jgi:branched-subunit amino acid ABC-type transport system permease component